jgi:hypothetical protein
MGGGFSLNTVGAPMAAKTKKPQKSVKVNSVASVLASVLLGGRKSKLWQQLKIMPVSRWFLSFGADVMILRIFLPKNLVKKLSFQTKIAVISF